MIISRPNDETIKIILTLRILKFAYIVTRIFYFQTDFKGLLGDDEDLSDVVNEIISDLAPDLFEEVKPSVLPKVADVIINLANEKLDGVTLQDLLDLLSTSALKKL
jgi:hypothetical protein